MENQAYFAKKKEIYEILLQYIESGEDSESNLQVLIREYEEQKIKENKNELLLFLRLLSKVQNNHYRCPGFLSKIQQILLRIKNDITQNFTNSEIYYIFKSDKLIVLFLIKQDFIKIDQSMVNLIIKVSHKKAPFDSNDQNNISKIRYLHYFYPEIKSFIEEFEEEIYNNELIEYDPQIFENFDEKRQNGQNESYICELIRNDSIEEFIIYINKNNYSVNGQIKPSIFETNSFLFSRNKTTFSEYAAFFGSIRILQYLFQNDAKIQPSIWLYAIHSQNPIIIDFLQQKGIEQQNQKSVIYESIKCHHNNIAHYLIDLIDNYEENNEYKSDPIYISFRYFNYEFIPNKFENIKYILHYACRYSYPILVNYLLQDEKIDINEEIELNRIIETPLNVSSKKKNLEIIDILLKNPKIQIGNSAFKGLESITEMTIPSSSKIIGISAFEGCTSLVHVVIPSSVTTIEDKAFCDCTSLKEIEIPSSVVNFGSNMDGSLFKNCTSLVKVVIHSQINHFPFYCFDGCKSLKEINIPSSVTDLSKYLFCDCESLEEIEIPSSITGITSDAFRGCKSLKSLNLPPSVTHITNFAFSSCTSLVDVVINSQSIEFNFDCFSNCKSLKKITFNGTTNISIGRKVFSNCRSLEHFEIPLSVTSINESVFYECTSLKEVVIHSSVYDIQDFAFYRCSSIKEINIPSSVKIIGNSAFREMTSLIEISIPSSVKEIGPLAFALCSNLTKITFEKPCSLTEIRSSIFDSCTSLTEFTVPSSVERMKNYIFYRCSSLKNVIFENPPNVNEIGNCIFRDCKSLFELEIPPSVKEIGSMAFMNCSSLSKIKIHSSLRTIKEKAFEGCTSLTSISLPSLKNISFLGLDQNVKINKF